MVDILFQILNFGIIIGLISYAVVVYARPSLQNEIAKQQAHEQDLHDDHHQLIVEQKHVENALTAQESECINYFNKINLWKSSVTKKRDADNMELAQFKAAMMKKMQQQAEMYKLKSVHKQITPRVIASLEKDFAEYFENEENVKAYMDNVIKEFKQ